MTLKRMEFPHKKYKSVVLLNCPREGLDLLCLPGA